MTHDVSRYLEVLKQQPDEKTILLSLKYLEEHKTNVIIETQFLNVLLDFTVPQIYSLTLPALKSQIIQCLQSVRGISSLLSKIQLGLRVDGSNMSALILYGEVLVDMFNDTLLSHLASDKVLDISEINKLVFKGQCFSIFNELAMKIELKPSVLTNIQRYVSFLTVQLMDIKDSDSFIKYFNSLLSLSGTNKLVIFDVIFTGLTWSKFLIHVENIKQFQRRHICDYLIYCVAKRFTDITKVNAVLKLMLPIFNKNVLDEFILERSLKLQSNFINALLGSFIQTYKITKQSFDTMVKQWGDANCIKTEPLALQISRTQLLIQIAYYGGKQLAKNILSLPVFLNAVTNRLNSYSNKVKLLAIVLSDKLCELSENEKIFLMEDIDEYKYLLDENNYLTEIESLEISESWEIINNPIIIEPDTDIEELTQTTNKVSKLQITKTYRDSDDSDSDSAYDDDEDPSVTQTIRLVAPVYIKELIRFLSVDKSHQQAYDMTKLALTSGPSLIRQKSQFGVEVSSNSLELLHILLGLHNHFNLANFEELRLNCLISVLVANPASAIDIVKMLNTGDFSLQQRIVILTSLSLAARDIRGFKDDHVTKSYKEKHFATKVLPPKLHQQYLALDERLDLVYNSIQDSLMIEPSEEAKDQISGGRILRISRRLNKPSNDITKSRYKDYAKIISKNFYFPLAYIWNEVGTIDIGHYSPILIGHYIKTMALLLHCSYASITNWDMNREFFIIATHTIKTAQPDEVQIIEGVITGFMIIFDISDEQHLVMNFGQYLAIAHEFISRIWQDIIDDKVKSLCAGFLIRLTSIFEKYQGNLIDQMNYVY